MGSASLTMAMSFLHGIEKLSTALLKERQGSARWLYPKPSSPFHLGWTVMCSTAMYCSLPSRSNRLYSPTTTRNELGWLTREDKTHKKVIKQTARSSLLKMEQRRLRSHVTCLKVKTVKYCPNPMMQWAAVMTCNAPMMLPPQMWL